MQKIGRYEVESELGKGAMGVVYKATDPNIGRPVALKTLRLDVHGIEAEEMRRRFQNEARAAGVLSHSNIITIYDAGEEDGLFYIAMEFIPGQTLAEILKTDRVLPLEQVVAITRGVCAGLDFAHSKGIIHRDIKPANIMIAPDGTAKIMDFGIAKAAGNLTNTGQVLGTPNYMSPEQVRGKELDGRTDLFSLGVMLYEMLTGEKPFGGQNVTTIIYKIVNESPVPPHDLDASIHPGLNTVVLKALSKDPSDRYQCGAELAADLGNFKTLATDANSTLTGMTTSMTSALAGEQRLIATGSTLSVAPVVIPQPSGVSQPAAVAAAPALAPAPARIAVQEPTTGLSTLTLQKRGGKIAIAIVALIVIVLAGLVAAKRYRLRQSANQRSQSVAATGSAPTVPEAKPSTSPQGEVTITSTPPGAKVEIDGGDKDGWVTPLRGEKLAAGKHNISLTLENYSQEKRTIDVVAGKKAVLDVKLTSNVATVHIASDPTGAEIVLNGQPTGKTTPADITVPPGNQAFTLRKQGYDDSGDTVKVEAGQSINITPKLTPMATPFGRLGKLFRGAQGEDRGLLIVRSRPRGAQVSINGVVLPAVTPVRIPIKSGRYVLNISMDGYQPVRRDVLIERGKQTGFDEELIRK